MGGADSRGLFYVKGKGHRQSGGRWLSSGRSGHLPDSLYRSSRRAQLTPPIAFTPVPLTEGHKEAWRAALLRGVMVAVNDDDGRATVTPNRRINEPQEWPEFLPPFLRGALKFAPDGKLWVRRTGPAGTGPTYDVIDAQGRVTQKVALPARSRLAGFGSNGANYVVQLDDDDLEHLRRYRLN